MMPASVILILTIASSASAEEQQNWKSMRMTTEEIGKLKVLVSEPIPIAVSKVGEKRWGHYQFPTISYLPDRRILVTYNATADRNDEYGEPGPAYVSDDKGLTWENFRADEPLITVSHSVISEVLEGEYLCIPMTPSLDITKEKIELPKLFGKLYAYGEVLLYKLNECPKKVSDYMGQLPAARWNTKKSKWQRETVAWETKDVLARTRKNDYVIPRPYIDNRIVRVGDRLFYPDFHLNHQLPDGSPPKNYACWCMVSDDNGKSWRRHGLIAYDETGKLMMGEPSLVQTSKGELACVIRCSHHRQEPMLVTNSSDGGKTWEKPRKLYDFGVMPQTLLLGNGVLVVSFGRPGVHLMFSSDGLARKWHDPLPIIEGNRGNISAHSCGYTRLLPLDESSFLLVYSDFKWPHPKGGICKSINVRRIEIGRKD
jgi:hypothetical protein